MHPLSPLAPGLSVGPYTLLRHLARGGTSDVYVARLATTPDAAPVALKLLSPLSPADRQRAEREAAIAASLSHPHIAALLDHGHATLSIDPSSPSLFLALELLRGETLSRPPRPRAALPVDAIALGLQLADALDHAHQRGVIHRDLKPSNVFLCSSPSAPSASDALFAKLLDFGVARRSSAASTTPTGALVGTPAYMSPEQVRGDRDIDPRTDLWSLGVTLFEALSQRLPFDADTTLAILFRIAFDPAPRLDALRPDLPPALCAIVHRCLARDRDARFPSAASVAAALRALPPLSSIASLSSEPGAAPLPEEVRLVTAVLARGVRDHGLLERLARELDARYTLLPDATALVAFGLDRWTGDEAHRALRLARAASFTADHVGVATGHSVPTAITSLARSVADLALAASALPGLGLDATTASLLRASTPLSLRPDGTSSPLPADPASSATPSDAPPFVGRSTDLAILLDAHDLATSSLRPAAALLLGVAGIGKTRTLDEALRRLAATSAAHILRVRCDRARRDAPMAALREALAAVDPLVAAALSPRAAVRDPQVALDGALGALSAVLRGLSRDAPVVLAIDDAHWLDASSRALLASLCDAPDAPALALWMTADPDAATQLRDLVAATSTRTLSPLPRESAAAMVASVLGRPDADLVDRGEGNPLFLEALARLALDPSHDDVIPPGIEATHRAALDRLGASERDFVKRTSVFGRTAWLEGAVDLGASPAPLDALRRRALLSVKPDSRLARCTELEFRSALLADVAHGLWPPGERASLHGQAAAWLSAHDDVTPEELGPHWLLAELPERAAQAWSVAAERAAALGATRAVCEHAARVLSLTRRPEARWRALTARDTALQLAGDRALQREGLTLLDELAASMDPAARAEVQWRWCHHARMVDDVAHAERAGRSAEALSPPGARWGAAATMELALLYADRGRIAEARERAAAAMSAALGVDDPWLQARAAHTLAYVLLEEGSDFDRALRLYRDAAAGYQRTGDRRREAIALLNGGAALAQVGRFGDALDAFDEARSLALRVGNARTAAVSLENRGAVRRALGEHRPAEDDLALALAEAARLGHRRLAEAARIERLYLALATDADASTLRARCEEVASVAAEAEAPAQAASAVAAALRAGARLGDTVAPMIDRARAMLKALTPQPMLAAELLVALWEVDGRRATDERAFAAALSAYADGAGNDADRGVRRRGFARRFMVPEGLQPG
ncbi:MAG: AAA family ATPase [Deltaproteobacteria bacterium]|nr:AAA family ATPase [Deltaproteobacteria bacterium]